jgi:hypothetical protein
MSDTTNTPGTLSQRFWREMRNFGIVSGYLFICFSILFLYRSTLLGDSIMHSVPFLTALGKALIIGKFILIGEAAKVGSRVSASTLLHRIAWKSLFFLVMLVILTALEELIVGWVHAKDFAQIWSEFASKSILQILSPSLVMLMVLIPLISFSELNRAMGPGKLKSVFFAAEK